MKKVLLLFSALALVVTLAACTEPTVDPITVSLGGLSDVSVEEDTVLNVLDGLTAMGSDSVDYKDLITADSDDCTITDNVLDTSVPGSCTITVSVVVDGKLDRDTFTVTITAKPLPPASENVVMEWNFDGDDWFTGWAKYENGAGSIAESQEEGALKMVTTSGGARYETRLDFMNVPLEQGYIYKVSFKMKSDIDGKKVHLNFGELLPSDPWFTPFKPEGVDNITLSTEWQTFEYQFMMELDNQAGGPLFEMGNQEGSENIDATIWMDDLKVTGGSGEDTIDPVLAGTDDVVIFVEDAVTFDPLAGVTATDNVDGDISSNVILSGDTVDPLSVGTYNLYYVIYDAAFNYTRVARQVKVIKDEEAPVLEGVADIVVFVGQDFTLAKDVKAMDNRDGDITANITVDGGGFDMAVEGVYTVTYTVVDAVGNETEVERRVEVSALEFNATDLVANGGFDMGPWKLYHANWDGATASSVANVVDGELVFEITNLGSDFWHNLVEQPGMKLVKDKMYRLSFDAKADVATAIESELVGRDVHVITTTMQTFTVDITATEDAEKVLKFLAGTVAGAVPATITIDNVKFEEYDGTAVVADTDQVVNGDFDGEFYNDGWNAVEGTLKVNDYSAMFNYGAAGNDPWSNKLEYGGVELEPGRIYMLKFSAKGDAERDFRTSFFGGNMGHESAKLQLTTDWKEFLVIFRYDANGPAALEFQLGKLTDNAAGSMFYVDNVVLEQAILPTDLYLLPGDELVNGSFDLGAWKSYHANWNATESTVNVVNEELVFEISNLGEDFWHNLVEQPGMKLVKDKMYKLSFDAKADVATALETELTGRDVHVITTTMQTFTVDITATEDAEKVLKFLAGTIAGAVPATITIDNVKFEEYDGTAVVANTNQVVNGDFTGDFQNDGWMLVNATSSETLKVNDYVAYVKYDGSPVGADSVLIETAEMNLENGKTYVLEFAAKGTARDFYVQVTDGTTPIMSEKLALADWAGFKFEFTYNSDSPAKIQLLLGDGAADSVIELDNFVLGAYELIDDLNFVATDIAAADYEGGNWTTYKHYWDGSTIDASFSQNAAKELVVDVKDVSYADWHALLEQGGYNLVVGKTYRVSFKAKASVARDINVELNGVRFDSDLVTEGNQGIDLTTEFVTYTADFVYAGTEDKSDAMLKIFFGKISDASVPSVITLDDIMVEEFDGTAVVADTNQTVNGTFDEFYTDGWFSIGSTFDVEWGEAVIKYDAATNNAWETAFGIEGLTWEQGETYLVEFNAKADAVRDFKLNLWDGGANQEIQVAEVGPLFNTYRFVFTYNIGENSKMEFHLGKITDKFEGTMFYVDNVMVSKLTEETPAS